MSAEIRISSSSSRVSASICFFPIRRVSILPTRFSCVLLRPFFNRSKKPALTTSELSTEDSPPSGLPVPVPVNLSTRPLKKPPFSEAISINLLFQKLDRFPETVKGLADNRTSVQGQNQTIIASHGPGYDKLGAGSDY